MKRNILIILLTFGLAYGASAQRGHGGAVVGGHGGHGYYGGGWAYHPRTYVGLGSGLGYPWWGDRKSVV